MMRHRAEAEADNVVSATYRMALQKAIESTLAMNNGDIRMKAANMVLLNGTHTIEGAGLVLNYSYGVVKQWNIEFVQLVAKNLKEITPEEIENHRKDEKL